jgi:hypothetical protein
MENKWALHYNYVSFNVTEKYNFFPYENYTKYVNILWVQNA